MISLTKALINTITLLLTLFINYWINAGQLGNQSVGEVSKLYDTLFTPAGYAFSIWGFIYLQLLAFVGFQWYVYFKDKSKDYWNNTGYWFALSNIANAAWVVVWINEWIGVSVLIMIILLFALIQLVLRLKLEIWDAPLRIIAFIWWPITFYTGWIILATVANIAAFLVSIDFNGAPLSPVTWTIVMIIIATITYLLLTYTRNMREASLIGIWGLVAIADRHWDQYTNISITALVAVLILIITSALHGYKNRKTSPINKWKRREI